MTGKLLPSNMVNLRTQGSSRYLQSKLLQCSCSITCSNPPIIDTAMKFFHRRVQQELQGQSSLTIRLLPSNMANQGTQGGSRYLQSLLLHSKRSSTRSSTPIITTTMKCFGKRVRRELTTYSSLIIRMTLTMPQNTMNQHSSLAGCSLSM